MFLASFAFEIFFLCMYAFRVRVGGAVVDGDLMVGDVLISDKVL